METRPKGQQLMTTNKMAANLLSSHKCCAVALCLNRSDNRPELTFHAFPKDKSRRKDWMVKMRRQDKKFASSRSLFCCSEHFLPGDYKRSLTGLRRDLKPTAVPSQFPWTKKESAQSQERSKRCERSSGNKTTAAATRAQ